VHAVISSTRSGASRAAADCYANYRIMLMSRCCQKHKAYKSRDTLYTVRSACGVPGGQVGASTRDRADSLLCAGHTRAWVTLAHRRIIVVSQCRTFCVKSRNQQLWDDRSGAPPRGTKSCDINAGKRANSEDVLACVDATRTCACATVLWTTVTHLGRLARSACSRSELARLLSGALGLWQGAGCSNRRSACALCCVCVDL